MKISKTIVTALGIAVLTSACATRVPMHAADDPRFEVITAETLTAFTSKKDYENWLRRAEALHTKRRKEVRRHSNGDEYDFIVVTGSRVASGPNITNVQNKGVDEGDIVKQVGDHLVLMQDGRLFSLSIGTPTPTLTARVNIYDEVGEGVWYDELLVSGRRLVVTGYNYDEDATEITVFDLEKTGQFSRQGTWYLESEDYYSGDNSATRMIGDTLIFHTQGDIEDPSTWPTLREKSQTQGQSILRATNIFPPLLRLGDPELHMVTECKISQIFACQSRAVIANGRADWIVTETDGYLWVAPPRQDRYINRNIYRQKRKQPATLYRFPLHTNQVQAVTLNAELPSRFAFEAREDRIFALVEAEVDETYQTENELAFLDLPLSEFSDSALLIRATAFTALPGEETGSMRMRFTDGYLAYSNFKDDDPAVYALNLETRLVQGPVSVPHEIDRLDRVGQNIVLIGEGEIGTTTDALGVSWLDLSGAAHITDTLNRPNRYEVEGRAQALNMRVDSDGSALLGLPTFLDIEGPNGWTYDDEEDGTDISFARVSRFGGLTDLGEAKGDPSRIDPNYECETSCVDWYGNARPFFIGERIFALIASELIELQETPNGIVELSRVNLSAPL